MAELPKPADVSDLLTNIEGIIGVSGSFPQNRHELVPPPLDAQNYESLWNTIDNSLQQLRAMGFPLAHQNPHRALGAMWAWCWTFPEDRAKERIRRPRGLYLETIKELQALKDAVSRGVDAPGELLRELRESMQRRNEMFVIMAFRNETDGFWRQVVEPVANCLSLKPVRIDREETEVAISEEILSSIRRSLLVLCDLSFERPNCYFEAGYAKGCFRRVLFTARHDHNPRSSSKGPFKVHFDLDQLKITWWNPDNFSSAKNEVEERVRNILNEIKQ